MQKNYFSQQAEEIANLGSWEIDLVSESVYWSDQFFRICGYKPNEVQPSIKLNMDMVHPDDRERTEYMFRQAFLFGNDYKIENRIVRPDGTIRYVYSQAIVDKDISGKPLRLRGVFFDITDRKEAEEARRQEEERYHNILNSVMEGFQILDRDFRYVYLNPSAVIQSRYSEDQIIGRRMTELYPGIEKTELFRIMKECVEEKCVRYIENEFTYPDGSNGWFELRIQPSAEGLLILSVDITERKRAEENKLKTEARYKALIENSSEGTTLMDKDFNVIYRSPSTSRIVGWTIDEREKKPPLQETHPEDKQDLYASMKAVMQDPRKPVLISFRVRHKLGHYIWLEGVMTNMLHDPAVEAIVMNFRDITERKEAEEKIRQMNDELEQKVIERTAQFEAVNKELEAFSYSVSHDLRAPLRAIDGYASMIEEDYEKVFDEEGRRLLGNIQQNAKKMSTLIDDLLAFSRLGKKVIQKKEINMNELLEGVLMDLGKAQSHHASINVDDLLPAFGDYSLIHQVLMNLVSNAIKYSSKKEKPVVQISSRLEGKEMVYTIRDNGVGFDMKYAHKLFGVFQRLHTMDEFEGTGVGLAIVQRIVTRHGGHVIADSKPDEGSVFSFSLPIQ
jgi:PAS domain S-box-containing protein